MQTLTEQIDARFETAAGGRQAGQAFRFRGTALVQGAISRNGRYYPPEVVAETARQADGVALTVYPRHRDAVEGSGLPVGRVERLYLEGPELKYEAVLAETRLGRDLQALIEGGFLVGASIRACPYTSHRARLAGRDVECVDALTLRGIDFTDDPGIPQAAGFEILEDAPAGSALGPPVPDSTHEEESMNLESLTLEALKEQRPDLAEALRREGASLLEEIRQALGVEETGGLPAAVRDLARLRVRGEIAAALDAELAGDPLRRALRDRLVEECATVAEARERLPRERAYLAGVRRLTLPGVPAGGEPAGRGLADNPETAAASPEQVHVRRLAGIG